MKEIIRNPLLVIDNLIRTLLTSGSIILAGLIISNQNSWFIKTAIIATVAGFLSFVIALQFRITAEMKSVGEVVPREEARDPRVAISFACGYITYITAGVFICLHYIMI